jgi:hypothetical protein
MTGSLGGVVAVDPGASTINAEKHPPRVPWEALSLGPTASTTKVEDDIDGGPPGGAAGGFGSVYHRV